MSIILLTSLTAAWGQDCTIVCGGPGGGTYSCASDGDNTALIQSYQANSPGVACHVQQGAGESGEPFEAAIDAGCVPLGSWYTAQGGPGGAPSLAEARRKAETNRAAAKTDYGAESFEVWAEISGQARAAAESADRSAARLQAIAEQLPDQAEASGCEVGSKAYASIADEVSASLGSVTARGAEARALAAEAEGRMVALDGFDDPYATLESVAAVLATTDSEAERAQAAGNYSALIAGSSDKELRVAARTLPDSPYVLVPLAQHFANTGDMDDYARAARLLGTARRRVDRDERGELAGILPDTLATSVWAGPLVGLSPTDAETWGGSTLGVSAHTNLVPGMIGTAGLAWTRDKWTYADWDYDEIRFSRVELQAALQLGAPTWWRLSLAAGPHVAGGLGAGKRIQLDSPLDPQSSGGWTGALGGYTTARVRVKSVGLQAGTVVARTRYWGYYDEEHTQAIEDQSQTGGWRATLQLGIVVHTLD